MKKALSYLIFMGISLFSTYVYSGELAIHRGADGFFGKGEEANMGEVARLITQKTGYAIYLDSRLKESKISFVIPEGASHQRAILQIARPHGHAITYVKTGRAKPRIRDIHIFKHDGPGNVDYMAYKPQSRPSSGGSANHAFVSNPRPASPKVSPPIRDVRALVKTRPPLGKDPFGAPGALLRPLDRGPDLRPTLFDMRKFHRKIMDEKRILGTKNRRRSGRHGRLLEKTRRRIYEHQKKQSISRILEQKKGE